jgi:hypothetical protein
VEANFTMSLSNEIPPESTAETPVGFEHWIVSEKDRIAAITARYFTLNDQVGQGVVEFVVTTTEGLPSTHRIPLGEGKVEETARLWLAELEKQSGLSIPLTVA